MPAKPPWHAHAREIRRDLEKLPIPVLDRAAVERLFGIERRTAQRLLKTLDGHVSSQVAVVTREAVIAMLDRLLQGKPAQAAAARKERLADALSALAREAVPKTTAIATVAVPEATGAWPVGAGISAPGVFQICFNSPEELLGRILAVTELAAADYAGFAARFAARFAAPLDQGGAA
jgi:hypothetical protein